MIFRLYFTGDQWYQTRFHGFIGYLYLFLVNLKNLCLFKNWCFLIIINFKVFFLKYSQDLSYLSYIYIYRACLLPVCGLPFCFYNSVFPLRSGPPPCPECPHCTVGTIWCLPSKCKQLKRRHCCFIHFYFLTSSINPGPE